MAAVDTYSSVTARPIRPLPKRRLRSRLSEEANAALFAPPQQPSTPLFYFPYNNYAGDPAVGGTGSSNGFSSGQGTGDNLQDSSDEEDNSSSSVSRGVGNGIDGSGEGLGTADPYEWAESTNNKKKRKIPTQSSGTGGAGGSGMSGSYSAAPHSSPGFSPTSASSPRSRWKSNGCSQRSPLSAISSANHASLRRSSRRCPPSPSADSSGRRLNGKASSEEPVTPTRASRQENTDSSGVPKQTQFTFVCESPVSANLFTSSSPSGVSGTTTTDSATYSKTVQTVGTQTSPNISNSNTAYPPTPQPAKKKSNRSRRPDYAQILQRRRRQEAAAHGNNNGEIWICEFCEYESIFGVPPEALMRQYEIKDRKERRRLAEKKRLLEKAKQKGKKNSGRHNTGKKGSHHNTNPVPPPPPPSTTDSQGTQSDNTPLASATQTPALKPQRHSQQVQTDTCIDCGGHHHVSHGRGATANGTAGTKNAASGGGSGGAIS